MILSRQIENTHPYIGRFAPTPSGPLHFGSIIAALGSYLQAKSHNGQWLLRIEDIDIPRVNNGATDKILYDLETLGLCWDGELILQNQREPSYQQALDQLADQNLTYPCACSRKEMISHRYDGKCRNGLPPDKTGRSLRIRTNNKRIYVHDSIQGEFSQTLENDIGDFIVNRADGIMAYHLAVIIDDAFQNVTEIVRGADLLGSTPRQIYLQKLLGFNTPEYCHLPVATGPHGKKISKQNHAPSVMSNKPVDILYDALSFLGQAPDSRLKQGSVDDIINWGTENWHLSNVPATMNVQI